MMACEGCQAKRGWWHKVHQQCAKCGGWPKPADERMAQHETGGSYYDDPERELSVEDFLNVENGRLRRFAEQTKREMKVVGSATYTAEEWRLAYADWTMKQ